MPDPQLIGATFDRPPEQALEVLRQKGLRPTVGWRDMLNEEHARDFTIAKMARLDLLATMKQSLDRALAEGRTYESWAKDVTPTLAKEGWWGLVEDKGLTGTSRPVFIGPRRLRTIYDTNMRMSRAAGQWARFQASKRDRPYIRYSAILDLRTRPEHTRWHGTILPIEHPWWQTHFPPCGWHCRCTAMSLSEADLKRRGWVVNDAPPPDLRPARPFWRTGASAPSMIPAGIDPGFAYNPGIAAMQAAAEKVGASLSAAAAAGALRPAQRTLAEVLASEVFDAFMANPRYNFPVMLVDDPVMNAIGAKTDVVWLSASTLAKQLSRHPELTIDDYRLLPELAEAAEIVVLDRPNHAVFARIGDRWLRAVIKATADGREVYVQSVRYMGVDEFELMAAGEGVLLDRRVG